MRRGNETVRRIILTCCLAAGTGLLPCAVPAHSMDLGSESKRMAATFEPTSHFSTLESNSARRVHSTPVAAAMREIITYSLAILNGELEGQAFDINKPVITLGRRADNDIAVPLDPRASRFHAQLSQRGQEWLLEDLGSANKTFIDGEVLEVSMSVGCGQEIRIAGNSAVYSNI